EFGAEAWSRHGLWIGGWMTLGRFSRCRPGGTQGADPVPDVPADIPVWQPWRYGRWRGGDG
ncbi:MAG: membrane protein insertion efficiency factor YidD, partial [Pseudomonadota bacterium]